MSLSRNTPLKRGTGLKADPAKALKRKARLRQSSGKRAASGRARQDRPQRRDTGPSRKTRMLVLERDGWACVCCGRSVIGQPYSLQHRKRRSRGGSNDPSNLVVVLGTGTTGCHQRINSRIDPADEAKGYTVRSWDAPAQVPVMLFSEHGSGITAWLWDDGQYHFDGPQEVAA